MVNINFGNCFSVFFFFKSKFFFMTKAIFFTQLSLVGYLPILLLMFCLICLMGLPVYFIIHIVFNLLDIKIIFSRHHYANQF